MVDLEDLETEEPSGEKTEKKEKQMPFTEHLEELRIRLFKIIGSVMTFGIIGYFFYEKILDFVTLPKPPEVELISLAPPQLFIVSIKLSFYAGALVSIPVIVYQFWQFIAPGLFKKERKLVFPIIFFTIFCFSVGAVFAFSIIIPYGLEFLMGFQTEDIIAKWSIDKYIDFVLMMVLVFGIVFELPLLALFLGKVGLINHKMMKKYRKGFVLVALILGAVLTPPDGFTQIALAIPLVILYEISIYLVRMVEKKKEKEEEEDT
ncbi:MAG: twin-arginine translocase subunit TatC [bacterium]|nr:twin-arginine translocase subunit TatC [bacterium]